jgi:hypothetical protein
MDGELIKQCAAHCRFLAENADPFIKQRLLDLAVSYDVKLDLSLRGPPTYLRNTRQYSGSAIAAPTGHWR